MFNILFYILFILASLLIIKIILGPTVWDRILFLNLFSSLLIILILMYSVIHELTYLIDIAIVYTLLGYIGIIFISRFIEGKGNI